MRKSKHATCNFFTALVCAATILSPTTVSAAKSMPVRYSAGIVTGSKQIATQDGNIWQTKRKLHIHKGSKVTVKFDTKGTKKKTDDKILSVTVRPEITTEYCGCVR